MTTFVKDLDTPLLKLSSQNDFFSLRDAVTGVHALGGIGSGKSTGTFSALAGAYFRAQMGGILTIAKPSGVAENIALARRHGRFPSVVVFDENEGFNFLTYLLSSQGMEGIGTVTECFMRILEAAKKASPTATQKGGEAFWEDCTRLLLRYSLLPLYAANGLLSIEDIINFVSSAPTCQQDVTDAAWQSRSFMYKNMDKATRNPAIPMSRETLKNNLDYWSSRWLQVPEKTRGNIIITICATLDRFLHGRLKRAFCSDTTIVPEMTFHGAIIILAMPTTVWNEDGVIGQTLFKYMWQRAVLTRNGLDKEHRERPVFCISDEAQETVSSYDGEFLGLARDSKACVVNLTQSLPAYYAKIGGDNPRDTAQALVGKFGTHVFHSQPCNETNRWAAETIGKVLTRRRNYSSGNSQSFNSGMSSGNSETWGSSSGFGYSHGGSGTNTSSTHSYNSNHSRGGGNNWGHTRGQGTSQSENHGYSESMEYVIEPGDFARILKTGGKQNNNLVTAVWFQSGRVFNASGSNVLLETFKQ